MVRPPRLFAALFKARFAIVHSFSLRFACGVDGVSCGMHENRQPHRKRQRTLGRDEQKKMPQGGQAGPRCILEWSGVRRRPGGGLCGAPVLPGPSAGRAEPVRQVGLGELHQRPQGTPTCFGWRVRMK